MAGDWLINADIHAHLEAVDPKGLVTRSRWTVRDRSCQQNSVFARWEIIRGVRKLGKPEQRQVGSVILIVSIGLFPSGTLF